MSESNWTDKLKNIAIVLGLVFLGFLIWQWQKPKIDPEDYAKTLAAQKTAEEQSAKYQAEIAAGKTEYQELEKEKTDIEADSKAKDKKIVSLEKFTQHLQSANCAGAVEPIQQAYSDLLEAKQACDKKNENCELRLTAMTDLFKKSEIKEASTSVQLAEQIEATKKCQEEGKSGSRSAGLSVYYDPINGRFGLCINVELLEILRF